MHPSLVGPRHKLAWAQEQIYGIEAEIATAHSPPKNPYRVLTEYDGQTGKGSLRVVAFEPLPFVRWSLLIGDIVHALRSTLDHTAYELARLVKDPPGYTEFPILTDADLWEQRNKRGALTPKSGLSKVRNLPPDTWAVIENLQPYKRGDTATLHPLWMVHALDIIDKHRRLNVVGAALLGSHFQVRTVDAELTHKQPLVGAIEDGAEIGTFTIKEKGPNPDVNVNAEFTFGVTLKEGPPDGPPIEGEDIRRILEGLNAYTSMAVTRFEQFFDKSPTQRLTASTEKG